MRNHIVYKMIHPGDSDIVHQAVGSGFATGLISGEAVTYKTLELRTSQAEYVSGI